MLTVNNINSHHGSRFGRPGAEAVAAGPLAAVQTVLLVVRRLLDDRLEDAPRRRQMRLLFDGAEVHQLAAAAVGIDRLPCERRELRHVFELIHRLICFHSA